MSDTATIDIVTVIEKPTKPVAKSKQPRSMFFNKLVGALFIAVKGKETGYWLDPIKHDGQVLGYRLSKFGTGRRPEGYEEYYLDFSVEDRVTCECRGYLSHGHCKHRDALSLLRSRGEI